MRKRQRQLAAVLEKVRDEDLEWRVEQLELTIRLLEKAPSQQVRDDLYELARRQILELNRNSLLDERGRRWLNFADELAWGLTKLAS